MKQYHLISACDKHYLPYAFVVYQSIIKSIDPTFSSSSDKDELVFHILIDDTVDEAELKLNTDSFSRRNQNTITSSFVIHKLDASLFQGLPTWGEHKSHSTYYRLLIDKLLDSSIEYILYFDIDVMFNADVRKIFKEYPLSEKVLGAVVDPGTKTKDKISNVLVIKAKSESDSDMELNPETYFNAGVLLINMNEWRKRNIGSKSMELAPKYDLECPDQDLLNYLVPDYEPMSWTYNFQLIMFYLEYNKNSNKYDQMKICNRVEYFTSDYLNKDIYEKISIAPSIVHFTRCKPWDLTNNFLDKNPTVLVPIKLAKALEQWHQIASATTEYIDERPQMAVSGEGVLYNYIIKNLITEIDELKDSIQKINRKRRMMRKVVIVSVVLILILYILQFSK